MKTDVMNQLRHRRGVICVCLLIFVVVGVAFWRFGWRSPVQDDPLDAARLAFQAGEHEQAERLARLLLVEDPQSIPAIRIGARSATQLEDWSAAVDYYDMLPVSESQVILDDLVESARIVLFELHSASDAERRLRDVRSVDQQHTGANIYLVGLFATTGRAVESRELILELLRQDRFTADHLLLLHTPWASVDNTQLLELCHAANPRDPLVALGLGTLASTDGRHDEAIQYFQQATDGDAGLFEARVRLGVELLRNGPVVDFLKWHGDLPAMSRESARIWSIRGEWAETRSESDAAARCYWEALQRNPRLQDAAYRLGQLLLMRGESELATPVLQHARLLGEMNPVGALVALNQGETAPMRRMVELLIRLGRVQEAWGWCRLTERARPGGIWFTQKSEELVTVWARTDAAESTAVNPAISLDLSHLPLPDWDTGEVPIAAPEESGSTEAGILFADQSGESGLSFRWHHTGDATRGLRMFEFTGGGVGVIDYDADFRPDLYFTQGTEHPESLASSHLDSLFQNVQGRAYRDVTALARLAEGRFSQGVSVADFDSDGFQDIYVGNIGANRLYQNNGDGTFSEAPTAEDAPRWTTSCCMVDLNDDGHLDLYDVNYLDGQDIFNQICHNQTGEPRLCLPVVFEAAADEAYLNSGDGTFVKLTREMGFGQSGGKGLGIVAGKPNSTDGLFLFVANDTDANFYFERSSSAQSGVPRFVESGSLMGVAYNGRGKPEGCMGIAAGDADADDLLDLFVTNFYRESNTLYVGRDGGLFSDATRDSGLRDSSLPLTGFGTQFLDANLDGLPDLVVVNGHVDDLPQSDVMYAMPAQFYLNLGAGRFTQLSPESVGEYFRELRLGRGLARVDWNRDRLEDFVVTHLDAPAALLTNLTPVNSHSVGVVLRGAAGRDGLLSSVSVLAGGRRMTRQLTAGDGYQASNDRTLIFGLGPATEIEEIVIRWSSGAEQRFTGLPADIWYLACEHRARLLALPVDSPVAGSVETSENDGAD